MVHYAEELSRRTFLGQAIIGSVFVGGMTSIAGSVTSTAAAFQGHPSLAVGNALGGIAVQTLFLAIADLCYEESNLEYSSVSLVNIANGVLLVLLLSLPLLTFTHPELCLYHFHPVTLFIPCTYVLGVRLVASIKSNPMWSPVRFNGEVNEEVQQICQKQSKLYRLWMLFLLAGLITGVAGYFLAPLGIRLSQQTGLSETFIGAAFTAVVTSLPELVTCITAIRRGALILAVSDILGGNTFDVLFLAFADLAYTEGSLYAAFSPQDFFLLGLNLVMTAVIVLGLLCRQKSGIFNIGFESAFVILIYGSGVIHLFLST